MWFKIVAWIHPHTVCTACHKPKAYGLAVRYGDASCSKRGVGPCSAALHVRRVLVGCQACIFGLRDLRCCCCAPFCCHCIPVQIVVVPNRGIWGTAGIGGSNIDQQVHDSSKGGPEQVIPRACRFGTSILNFFSPELAADLSELAQTCEL